MTRQKRVVSVLNDLMFTVKIQQAAKQAGLEPVFVTSRTEAVEHAKESPALVIIDLNYTAAEPLDLITALKRDEQTRATRLVGYVSHVQTELRKAAENAGCDVVIARSAFVQNLPEILR